MSNLISKRFVIRQSLVGKNVTIEFTNKKGKKYVYNHDKAFNIMKSNLEKMACFINTNHTLQLIIFQLYYVIKN